MAGAAQKFAYDIADLRRRIVAVERGSQLRYSTITGVDGGPVRAEEAIRTGITASAQAADAIDAAATAQAKADGAVVSFFGPTTPVGAKEGDLWRKADGEEPLQYVGGVWSPITDPALRQDVDEALDRVAGTEGALDGKISTYYAPLTSAPAAAAIGDLWFVEGTNYLRRWTGAEWVDARDAGIEEAQSAADTAQSTADSAATAASSAQSTADTAKSDAATAAGIAESKADVLIQSTAPAADMQKSSTLWIDTTGGANTPKRWSGTAWDVVTDKAATDAANAAATAQSAADTAQATADAAKTDAANAQSAANAAQTAADNAQADANAAQSSADSAASDAATAAGIAEGKADVLIQAIAPAAGYQKDTTLWIDTANGANTPKRWSGTAWDVVTDKAATDAATAAATAQTAADDAATAAATAQSTADAAKTDAANAQTAADNAATAASSAQSTADSAASAASAAQSAADAAQADASAAQSTADTAKSDAASAAGIAEGKADVLIQSTAPAVAMQKDTTLWIDTTSGTNKPKRWNATTGAWDVVTDKAATDAASAAATAQSTADTAKSDAATAQSTADSAASAASTAQARADEAHTLAGTAESNAQSALTAAGNAQSAADSAQATADGRPVLLFDTLAPSGTAPQGSTWFRVNSSGQVIGQWQQTAAGNASTWTLREIRSEVIANLDVGKLVAGTAVIDSAVANKIITEVVEAQTITGATIQSAPPGSARTLMDSTGFHAYDAAGTETVRLGDGDNLLTGTLYTNGPGKPGVILIPVTSTERPGVWFSEGGGTGSGEPAIYADDTYALTLRGKSDANGRGPIRVLGGISVMSGSVGGGYDGNNGLATWLLDSGGGASFKSVSCYGGAGAGDAYNVTANYLRTSPVGTAGLVLLNTSSGAPGMWFSSTGSLGNTQPAIYADTNYDLNFRGRQADASALRFTTGARIVGDLEYWDPPTSTFGANLGIASSPKDRIYKLTSRRSSKVNIHDAPLDRAEALLNISPRLWLDRTQVEARIGKEHVEDGHPGGPRVPDTVVAAHKMKRKPTDPRLREIPGLVAEEVEAAGLKEYVVYTDDPETGEQKVESVAYDRLWTLLIPIVKDLRDRVAELEADKAPRGPHASRIAALEKENAEQAAKLAEQEERLAKLEAAMAAQ